MEEKKNAFLTGEKLSMLAAVFAFGGFFGFIYEEIFYFIDLGYLVKRGTTLGPWIPIYGFGAVGLYVMCSKIRSNIPLMFMVGLVGSGILEYVTGAFLYNVFDGLRLWDYNTEIWNWGNIQGYVCLRSVLFFGVSAVFMMKLVVPMLEGLYSLKPKAFSITAYILATIALLDIIVSNLLRII